MNKIIKAIGGPKVAILIVIILAALAIFAMTVGSTGNGYSRATQEHGHSHD
jgi:hypothetical protein